MLQDRVVLVTGSTSGIGLATAKAALAAGAKVFVHGPTEALVDAARNSLGVPGAAVDLALPDAGDVLVEAVLAAYGHIDGVVNNAAIFPRYDIAATNAAVFDHVMAIDARAPMLVARRAVAAMRAQGTGGSIVNVGSVNAYSGQPDLLPYSMAKGALMTMTRNLADALGPERIRVNQINPGWVLTETEIATQRAQGRPDDWHRNVPPLFAPSGSILTPEQVAEHIVFWLSDKSAPVSGQVYEVDQYPTIGRMIMSRVM
jgi:NAD(P)-dependent dehydrogenase (short-subunit alcohol dehydrogenase family)